MLIASAVGCLAKFADVWILLVLLGVWVAAWTVASKSPKMNVDLLKASIEAGLSFVSVALPIVAGAALLRFEKKTEPIPAPVMAHVLMALYWLVISAALAAYNLGRLPTIVGKTEDPLTDKPTAIFGVAQLFCLLLGAIRLVLAVRGLVFGGR